MRHTTNNKTVPNYNTYDLNAATSPADKMTSDWEPCITTFRNKLYIFTKEKGLSNLGFVTTDGLGTFSPRTNMETANVWSWRTPSAIEFNGRLWLAISGADEAKPGSGRNYVFVASSPDGKEWTKPTPLSVEGSDAGVDGWAATNDKVTFGIIQNALSVIYTGAESGPRTYSCRLNPFGSDIPGPLRTRYIPSWNFSHANAITWDPKHAYLFCHNKNDGEWKGAVYLTDTTEDGVWNKSTNLGEKVKAFTNKTPAALVVPGLPVDEKFPWRVWLYSKGNGDDKYIYEHSFSI